MTHFNLQEELQQISDPSSYIITNDIDGDNDAALTEALEGSSNISADRYPSLTRLRL